MMNHALFEVAMDKATHFFTYGILPEVLGNWYSRLPPQYAHMHQQHNRENQSEPTTEKWCFCCQEDSGEMIQCDNEQCKISWFHTECLRISKVLHGNGSALSVLNKRGGRKKNCELCHITINLVKWYNTITTTTKSCTNNNNFVY